MSNFPANLKHSHDRARTVRLDRNNSFLLIIDIQSKLAPAILGEQNVRAHAIALIRAARLLGIPVFATEHCADRIGPLVPELRTLLDFNEIMGKRQFSCADNPAILARLRETGRTRAILAGMESHVCVMQSALGLADNGFTPCFVSDASGSRHATDHALATERMRTANVPVVSAEMVMFEWLGYADDPAFRDVLRLVKSL